MASAEKETFFPSRRKQKSSEPEMMAAGYAAGYGLAYKQVHEEIQS